MKSPEVAARALNAKKSLRLSGIDASFVSMASVWKSLRLSGIDASFVSMTSV